ncbi:hypothetical protein ACFQ4J_15910 [Laceyella tengchongensis]
MKMQWYRIFVITLFICVYPIMAVYAESADARLEELETEMKQLQTVENQYDFLKEEVKSFREFMENQSKNYQEQVKAEKDGVYTFLSIVIGIGGILFTAFTFFFYWQWGQTRKDMQDLLETERKKAIDKFNTDLNEIRDGLKKWISKEKNEIESRFLVMTEMINREIKFRQTHILLVGGDEQATQINEQERELLQQHHIEIEPFIFEEGLFKERLGKRSFDIIMYRYRPTNQGQDLTLKNLITQLNVQNEFIPLVIYSKDKMVGEDKKQIDSYNWVWLANFYTTFINHLFTLSHAFSSMKSRDKA